MPWEPWTRKVFNKDKDAKLGEAVEEDDQEVEDEEDDGDDDDDEKDPEDEDEAGRIQEKE